MATRRVDLEAGEVLEVFYDDAPAARLLLGESHYPGEAVIDIEMCALIDFDWSQRATNRIAEVMKHGDQS